MNELRNQFDKETKYFFSDRNYREYSSWLEVKNQALLEALPPLIEEAANMKDQYGCDCGHPYCRVCADTKTLAIAIDGAEKAIQGDE